MAETEKLILWVGIHKGIGDQQSAEQGARSLSFITPRGEPGLKMSLQDAWQPRRPGLKNGGIWSDGALQDGRVLLGDVVENVIEQITLISTDGDMLTSAQRIEAIQRFINDARQFTSTFNQIEPCYLEWSALGGKGSQYALIYNIDMDVQYDYPGAGTGNATVTLMIEREPVWRALPPGAHPRQWTFESRGLIPGKDWNYEDLDPFSTNLDSLIQGTVALRNEYSLASDDYDYPSVSDNWIDIDKSLIPGDAPALVMISLATSDNDDTLTWRNIYVSRTSKPAELTAQNSGFRGRPLTINFCDKSTGVDTQLQTDSTRGVKRAGEASLYVVRPGANESYTLPGTAVGRLSANAARGRYNMFIRGFSHSGNVAADDIFFEVYIAGFAGSLSLVGQAYAPPAAQNNVQSTYIGSIAIPPLGFLQNVSSGLQVRNNALMSANEFSFRVDITNNGDYSLIDLVLVPIDEACMGIRSPVPATGSPPSGGGTFSFDDPVILDNTGYFGRGQTNDRAVLFTTESSTKIASPTSPETMGKSITLVPHRDNRLSLFVQSPNGGSDDSRDEIPVKIDIIPRCYGVRAF